MQDQAKLSGLLESESPSKIELMIDGEMYVIKKNDIIAIFPYEVLEKNLEDGVLIKDLILLKNKMWFFGEFVEISSKTVYFKSGSSSYLLDLKDVDKIYLKEKAISLLSRNTNVVNNTEPLIISKLNRQYVKEGFYHIVYGNFITKGLGAQYSFGYQFSRIMGLGLGIGYFDPFENAFRQGPMLVPIYTEARGYLSEGKSSFYYNLAIGFTTGTKFIDEVPLSIRPGIYTYPAIGFKNGSNKASFLIDIGLKFSSVSYDYLFSELGAVADFTEEFESNSVVSE
jgi:hypothetical protein